MRNCIFTIVLWEIEFGCRTPARTAIRCEVDANCGMTGEAVYERQDLVMAVRNGTTEALDS
jgi:hypothetical protein